MIKVEELKIGDKIKFNNNRVDVYVTALKSDRAMLSKTENGLGLFSISFSSPNFEDLKNRVEFA